MNTNLTIEFRILTHFLFSQPKDEKEKIPKPIAKNIRAQIADYFGYSDTDRIDRCHAVRFFKALLAGCFFQRSQRCHGVAFDDSCRQERV